MIHHSPLALRALACQFLIFAACVSSPAQDILSVNFYDYGPLAPADRDKVTIEADESAGFGTYNTTGLENYKVPEWIEFLTEFPKTANGKFDLISLRQQALDQLQAVSTAAALNQSVVT